MCRMGCVFYICMRLPKHMAHMLSPNHQNHHQNHLDTQEEQTATIHMRSMSAWGHKETPVKALTAPSLSTTLARSGARWPPHLIIITEITPPIRIFMREPRTNERLFILSLFVLFFVGVEAAPSLCYVMSHCGGGVGLYLLSCFAWRAPLHTDNPLNPAWRSGGSLYFRHSPSFLNADGNKEMTLALPPPPPLSTVCRLNWEITDATLTQCHGKLTQWWSLCALHARFSNFLPELNWILNVLWAKCWRRALDDNANKLRWHIVLFLPPF